MRHISPQTMPLRRGTGIAAWGLRPDVRTGLPRAAEAIFFFSTRTLKARADQAAPSSIFERAQAAAARTAQRAWSDFNDNAHVDRRAPPGGNSGGGRQGKPDRGI